jgi:hypothetical protein
MLAPSQQDVRWVAVEALIKINTEDAAKALQAHLREEMNLSRKLELAEFLGRHGIRDGYPYAIEHMSLQRLYRGNGASKVPTYPVRLSWTARRT